MEPFLGEIRIFSFGLIPRGWAACNGQLLSIAQNSALFSLLGTQYGGDGRTNFALPDLRGRAGVHFGDFLGAPYALGQAAGSETVTLTTAQLPAHNHLAMATTMTANFFAPVSGIFASVDAAADFPIYGAANNLLAIDPSTVTADGGGQPHENMQPFLVLNACIALQGIFPSHS